MTTIWAQTALTPQGWIDGARVAVDASGRIASVSSAPSPAQSDVRVGALLPAPANLHSHAFQRALAGLTEGRSPDAPAGDSFWTWRNLMYRFLETLTPGDVEAIAAMVQVETLEAGYASIGEFHYLHHQPGGAPYDDVAEMSARIAAAAAQTGVGLTLLPVLYERGGCDGRALAGGQTRFGSAGADAFAALCAAARGHLSALPADARIGAAPHSLRAVSPESLGAAAALAAGGPIHIHIAEQTAEVAEVEAAYGARPVQWLLERCPVGPDWCLIHATHMTPAETSALAQTDAVAGLCPITEANLGDGIFDGARYAAAGGRFGVGSDSNVRIALSEELRVLEYAQRLHGRARAVLAGPGRSTGRTLYDQAAACGAQALGRDAGQIAVGRWADLTALSLDTTAMIGRSGDSVLDSFIFAGDDRLVTDVWSAGRRVVQGGRHVARDAVQARYRDTLGDVLRRA